MQCSEPLFLGENSMKHATSFILASTYILFISWEKLSLQDVRSAIPLRKSINNMVCFCYLNHVVAHNHVLIFG